ncbi:hypothetical protein DFP72DRAFT_858119 [Ephemerocybe angulata]|uniref:Uncharacterized protein n=1 Tax=Ephemerocybe angulata TaxID=980116 RepID=A0A8H6LVR4_9AGAR|nr:hypothetical protein DFP72DRAFT_858119 [Tulosesus angulatus]
MQIKQSLLFCMLALSGFAAAAPIATPAAHGSEIRSLRNDRRATETPLYRRSSRITRRERGNTVYRRGPPPVIKVYDPNGKPVSIGLQPVRTHVDASTRRP